MRRALMVVAFAAAFAAPAAAEPNPDAHRHSGSLFQLRFEPELNRAWVYRAFLAEPDHMSSLIIERSNGWLGDAAQVDVTPSACPAAAAVVARLGGLRLPAVALENSRPYDMSAPRAASYHFAGFVHFPNGGEGEATFYAYDAPGQPADPLLAWARDLVRAVDACRPKTGG